MRQRVLDGPIPAAVLALASAVALLPVARLDFDRHHDGYMLAQAIAVSDGLAMHRDVFGQYGPVTAWLQAVALGLPVGPALALRLSNVLFIAVTVFLLADMGRRRAPGWPVSRAAGWWAAGAWIVLADVWLGLPMLPWSGTAVAMLSVAAFYLITRSTHSLSVRHDGIAALLAAGGGAVLGILPFVRINVGIASMGIAALGGLLALMKAGKRGRSLLAWAAVGTVLSVGLIVMVLGLTGSLSAYIDQAVLFPLSWAGSSSTSGTSAGFLLVFLEQLLPSVVLVGALLLQWGRRSGRAFTELTDRQAATATVVAGILVVVWVARVLVVSIDMPLARWMSDRFVHTSLVGRWSGFLYVFLELSAIVCVALVARFVVAWRGRRAQVLRSTGWLLLAGFGFAGMTQVLPISDPRHVWWALPMGLLALFSAVATITHLPSPSSNPLLIPLAAATVVSLVSAIAYIGNERVPAPAGSVARGMLVPDAVAAGLSSDLATLAPFLEGGGSGIFLTEDGDLSVMEESYTSADPYFVGWGPVPDLSSRVSQRPFIVLTRGYGDDVWESAVQRLPGYRLAAENDRMRVFVADGIRPATENP